MKNLNYQLQPYGRSKAGICIAVLMLCFINKAIGQMLHQQPLDATIKITSNRFTSVSGSIAQSFTSIGILLDSSTDPNTLPRFRTGPTPHLSSVTDSQSLAHLVQWHQQQLNNTQSPVIKADLSKNKWRLPLFTFLYPHQKSYLYLRNEDRTFGRKAARGQLLIGGIEAIGMIALILMPKEVTKWEDDWMQDAGRNLNRAFTSPPVYDKDDWAINYIGHPVAGSYYYNAVRSQRASWWQSLLFATAQSFIWEYVIEGVAEQPSIQDLWLTPLGGIALGEPIHQATLAMRKNGYTLFEKIVVFILNPMFVLNNGYRVPPKPTHW